MFPNAYEAAPKQVQITKKNHEKNGILTRLASKKPHVLAV
jgi:hypothetical protein